MEQIFEGKVFEILPTSNGIIFSYFNGEQDDGTVQVSYKMISFENRRITDIAKNIYMVTKFGNGYKAVEKLCENYITVKSLLLPGGNFFILHNDGTAQLVGSDGEPIWTGSLTYRGFAPADIILFGDGLWACYKEANILLKFGLENMKQELRIGGKESPFDGPCDLFDEDGNLVVCSKNSAKIQTLNLNDYEVGDMESFEEPLLQYVKVGNYKFVVLESGLYVL